jgi:phosphate transport system permease protein
LGASKWGRVKLYFQSHFQISLPVNIIDRKSFWRDGSILFTVAAYFLPKLPSIFDQAMALPYHLYVISTSGTDIENQERWLMVQHLY